MYSESVIEIFVVFTFVGIAIVSVDQHLQYIVDNTLITQNAHMIGTWYFNRMDFLIVLLRAVGPFLARFQWSCIHCAIAVPTNQGRRTRKSSFVI